MGAPTPTEAAAGWCAALSLRFGVRAGKTVLVERHHAGPLLVQRMFYPETDGSCHGYVLHPPGGIVQGDRLDIKVLAEAGARVLMTAPAAAKFYRSEGRPGVQDVSLQVAEGACLEWLPQETIVFNRARASLSARVDLAADASLMAWDIICLGRPAAGERFTEGWVASRLGVYREGLPLWLERSVYPGAECSGLADARWGLQGHPVLGVLLVAGPDVGRGTLLGRIRERVQVAPRVGLFGATCTDDLITCRFMGEDAGRAREVLTACWRIARPVVAGKAAVAPRIWRS